MIRSVLQRDHKLILDAIDALIELEGAVYENGLTSAMSTTLKELRTRESQIKLQLHLQLHPIKSKT